MNHGIIRRFLRKANALVIGSVSAYYLYAETYGLESRKNKHELKIDNIKINLPPKLNSLVNEVLNDMKLKNEERSLITPIVTGNLDMKHAGYLGGKHGVLLEIPHYFIYDNKMDYDFTLVVDDWDVPKSASTSETLKSTLVFSDEAKKFAIAHELYEAGHSSFYMFPLLAISLITLNNGLIYLAQRNPNNKLNRILILLEFQLTLILFTFFIMFYDVNSVQRECDADLKTAELGKSYIAGGIEYYEKLLERNKNLKKINPNVPYDDMGDINVSYIRVFHMSLQRRIKYLKELLRRKEEGVHHSSWDYFSVWEVINK